MISRALRPLEYFNLKALHGETYLLSDDFYYDEGQAEQPEFPVFDDYRLAFPKLDHISDDTARVIDYSIVSFWLTDEIINCLQRFEKADLLESLDARLKENSYLDYRIYEIVAEVLGPFAADWVRSRDPSPNSETKDEDHLSMYAKMIALCLPRDEGLERCIRVLNQIDSSRVLGNELHNLAYFQDERSLDWIESNIQRMESLSASWGIVAAASKLSWNRVVNWLEAGRPLSLVALDALYNCSVMSDTQNAAMWFRKNPVRLLFPESIEKMDHVLQEYLQADNVPRTRKQIDFIVNNWSRILKN